MRRPPSIARRSSCPIDSMNVQFSAKPMQKQASCVTTPCYHPMQNQLVKIPAYIQLCTDTRERLPTCTDNMLGHFRSYRHENKSISGSLSCIIWWWRPFLLTSSKINVFIDLFDVLLQFCRFPSFRTNLDFCFCPRRRRRAEVFAAAAAAEAAAAAVAAVMAEAATAAIPSYFCTWVKTATGR